MALPPLSTVEELERRVGKPIPEGAERDRALALISDASTLVRHEAGRTWVDAEGELLADDVPDMAVVVTLAAAQRAWYNPGGVESTQVGAVSIRFGDVWLTAIERDRLADMSSGGLLSIPMKHGYGWEGDLTGWVPTDHTGTGPAPGGDWFPIGY